MAEAKSKTGIVLSLDGQDKKFDAISCTFYFNQGLLADGKPNGNVSGGTVQLAVFCTKDKVISEWLADSNKTYDGKVIIHEPNNSDQTMKTLEFKKGYCIHLAESYSTGPSGTQSFTIAADEITLEGTAIIQNHWDN